MTDQSQIKWAISTFKPFKSAETDEIVSVSLQHGMEYLAVHMCRIFRACLAHGYVILAWRQARVTFIAKPRKASYTKAKACSPINISHFY
jgi:hypothetical protein